MPRDDPKTPPHPLTAHSKPQRMGPTQGTNSILAERKDLPTMHRGLERPPPTMHRGGPPFPSMPRERGVKEEPRPGCLSSAGPPGAAAGQCRARRGAVTPVMQRGRSARYPACPARTVVQGLTHHRRWRQAVNSAAAARPGTTAPAPPVGRAGTRDWADVWLPRSACAAVWTVPVVLSEEGLSGASARRSPRKGVWASPLAHRVYLVRSAAGFARA